MKALSSALSKSWDLVNADACRWVRLEDVAAREEVTLRVLFTLLYRQTSLRAVAWFRLGSALKEAGVRGIPHWTERRVRRLYGLEIPVGADIRGGLYIAHPVGSVLVAESIGENVTIIAQVTLGMRGVPKWPVIGDRVFIGAGARVLGGITVGHDAKVGANAVVLSDVRHGATVVGIPARSLHEDVESRRVEPE